MYSIYCQSRKPRTKVPPYDSKNSIGRTFTCPIHFEPEICLNAGTKVADTDAKIEVEALLDSGAMGLFINHTLLPDNYGNRDWPAQFPRFVP
jgi:hypothetical protein